MKRRKKKGLYLVLGILLLVVLFFAVAGPYFMNANNQEQAAQETILPSEGAGRALLLYQESRMGLTKEVADFAARELAAAGYTVVMNHPREDSPYQAQDFDVVVLASPVYAGHVSRPLLDYAGRQDFSGTRVLVLLTGADLSKTAELEAVKAQVTGAASLDGIKVNAADAKTAEAIAALVG